MSPKTKLTGKVAAILNPRELAMNIGASAGVERDMIFVLVGEAELKDPDTQEVLGTVRHEKGRVKVVVVKDKFAIARTFDTYEVNIGGVGQDLASEIGQLLESSSGSFSRYFDPPNWVTRVKTLEYEDTGLARSPLAEQKIFAKVGDILELAE